VAVVVFVLLGGFGGGDPRGITLVVRAVVSLSGGALVGLSEGETPWTLYAPPMPATARLR
jgi:hypothetical protein